MNIKRSTEIKEQILILEEELRSIEYPKSIDEIEKDLWNDKILIDDNPEIKQTKIDGYDVYGVDGFKIVNGVDGIVITTDQGSTEECVSKLDKISKKVEKRCVSIPLTGVRFSKFLDDAHNGEYSEFDEVKDLK